MRKLWKFSLAIVLTLGAFLSTPREAAAINWCQDCLNFGWCYSCCRCDGFTHAYCSSDCP